MEPWLQSATGYIRDWLEFQLRASEQPGCIVAIAHRGKVVAEDAFGHASLATGEKLTPRHRFRIASHSKSFTAAGIMKLRERRQLRLDDPVGQYVKACIRRSRKRPSRKPAMARPCAAPATRPARSPMSGSRAPD